MLTPMTEEPTIQFAVISIKLLFSNRLFQDFPKFINHLNFVGFIFNHG